MNSKNQSDGRDYCRSNSAQENFKSSPGKHKKERKEVEENTEKNQSHEQLATLYKMNLYKLRDFVQQVISQRKICCAKMLWGPKTSSLVQ